MDEIFSESTFGGIQFRDKWQFELKSELLPVAADGESIQSQEFYIFIPNSLQINDQTYTKQQFYDDQTNLIRFKTPNYTMEELLDPLRADSPFVLLENLLGEPQSEENQELLENEVKLLADIFNSSLRDKLIDLAKRINPIKKQDSIEAFLRDVSDYLDQLEQFRKQIAQLKEQYLAAWPQEKIYNLFTYVDEFLRVTQGKALTQFLHRLRLKQLEAFIPLDQRIVKLLLDEKEILPPSSLEGEAKEEFILYHEGLLNKFVIDPLLLKTSRSSVDQKYKGIILGLPAAIAMFIYMILFAWQWHYFIVNSEPFIVLTVIIYVMKDRIKEELRFLSYQQAARWFSDYTTEIHSNGTDLGTLRESFSFIEEAQIEPKILEVRDKEFHGVMERFKRPEQVIYYKKTVTLSEKMQTMETRFYGLNLIFRFDIHHFLTKAEDAYQATLVLDPDTKLIRRVQLPRVYHINIIMKTTLGKKGVPQIDKFRLIVDKSGIKRVENLTEETQGI